ncbi:hypothetical protein [Actinokineospora sp. HUAS TT18]|uniref:hypothetical protein n=1 Tax=Actinokineospora sp. HUAS TT18 TaxID=3447451 RepID=UPI003F51C352
MRKLVGIAAVAVLAAGCGESKPAAVSDEFKQAVSTLLSTVDKSAAPKFEAVTCGSVLDSPSDPKVVMWADVEVRGVSADKLTAAGVAAGWQPQTADGYDAYLTGPGNVALALRGSKVRAEKANCSVADSNQQLGGKVRPALTDKQSSALAKPLAAGVEVAAAIHEVIGKPLDTAQFPASGKPGDAPKLDLSTCGEAKRGATFYASSKHDLGSVDVADLEKRMVAAVPKSAKVDERPAQPGYFQVDADGAKLTVSAAKKGDSVEFTLTMNGPCVPVA